MDRYQRAILNELQRDSRQSIAELAEKVGISTTPCWRRVKELEEQGIIRRFTALLDRKKLNLGVCVFANVRLNHVTQDAVDRFVKEVFVLPQVLEIYETSGEYDFILKVVAPSIEAYNDFQHGVLLKIPGIAHLNSSFAMREIKYETALPVP
jgi:Lrp/AsnC family leucine-responsive transcriptional regulator